jgi:hypothetical protein
MKEVTAMKENPAMTPPPGPPGRPSFTGTGRAGGAGIRLARAAAVAVLAMVGLAGSAVAASASVPAATPQHTGVGVSKDGLVLNVVNNSTHELRWVGDGTGPDPASTPSAIVAANGGTDRIVWNGTNLQIHPTWQVVGTETNVFPSFGVPLFGFNTYACTVDDISKGSPVGMTHCDIGNGYDPDAHVTFGDRTTGAGR